MPYIVLDPTQATPIPAPVPNPVAPGTGAGMTLAAARTELVAMLKGRQDIETERYDFWLNRAYIDIATSTRHDELKFSVAFTTVPEQALYLLPDFTITTLTVARTDADSLYGGVPLTKIDLTAYRTRKEMEAFQGIARKPMEYFRHNRLLVVYPTPDDAYEMVLDVRCEPQPLTEDNHVPILRPEWHETWLLLARKKMLGALAEWEANIAAGNDLASHMRLRRDNEADEDENRVIRSSAPRTEAELLRKRRIIRVNIERR